MSDGPRKNKEYIHSSKSQIPKNAFKLEQTDASFIIIVPLVRSGAVDCEKW